LSRRNSLNYKRFLKLGGKSDLVTYGLIALGIGAIWYFGVNPSTRKIDLGLDQVIENVTGGGSGAPTEIPSAPGIKQDTTNLDLMTPIPVDTTQLNNERPKGSDVSLSNIIPRLPSQAYLGESTDYYTDNSPDVIYQTIAGAY
jgi:hypothetical protein